MMDYISLLGTNVLVVGIFTFILNKYIEVKINYSFNLELAKLKQQLDAYQGAAKLIIEAQINSVVHLLKHTREAKNSVRGYISCVFKDENYLLQHNTAIVSLNDTLVIARPYIDDDLWNRIHLYKHNNIKLNAILTNDPYKNGAEVDQQFSIIENSFLAIDSDLVKKMDSLRKSAGLMDR